jgi:hypothetical protein
MTLSEEESTRQFSSVSIQSLRHDPKTSLNWWGKAPFPTMLIWASRIYEFQLYMERIMGFPPARGLSRQVGYQSGVDGVEAVRQALEKSGAKPGAVDLLFQGPAVIAGAGWGKAEVEYDDSTGQVSWNFASGTALGVSAKAKGVVRKHPACTFMEGFIAGWTNSSLGTKYEFDEVACVAKGDNQCAFHSMPLLSGRRGARGAEVSRSPAPPRST